jgi:polyvinyl alcohol dehydrogenase (cytochrome)
MRGHDYGASSFSPAVGIGRSNVAMVGALWRFTGDGAISARPAVAEGVVFAGSSRGTLYALDLATGRKKWEVSLGARSQTAYGFDALGIGSTPMLANHRVYVATAMTDVYALDEATGGFMWRTRVGDPTKNETVWSAPLVWHGRIYVGIDGILDEPTARGRLVALDAATGAVDWTFVVPQYTGGGGAGVFASPALDPATGTLFIATGNPTPKDAPPPGPDPWSESVLAINAETGHLRWAFGPTYPHDDQDRDFLSTPNVFALPTGTAVGAGQKDGTYYALDALTGRLLWKTSLTLPQERGAVITSSAAVAYGKIFIGTQDYPPSTTLWSTDLPGRLVALDAATGRILWSFSGPQQILGEPAVANGVVFAADYGGTVWGVDAQTGRLLWRATVGGFVWKGGVSLGPGFLLVGVAAPANALVAFGVLPQR